MQIMRSAAEEADWAVTTPLIVLGLLIGPSLGLHAWGYFTGKPVDSHLGAVLGLSIVFMFTGVRHFARTEPMAEMLPPWVPYRTALIYFTGLLEFALAAALLLPRYRGLAGWACIAILILFFPANIYPAINQVGMGGHRWGSVYLLVRAPLQLILIGWAYWFVARKENLTGAVGGQDE